MNDLTKSDYVSVPIKELEKLEQARKDLYGHLGEHVGRVMMHNLTKQIWRVANTRHWHERKSNED